MLSFPILILIGLVLGPSGLNWTVPSFYREGLPLIMEILMASLAFQSHLISETWLTSLVIMALLTSIISLLLIKLVRTKAKVHEFTLDCPH